MSDEELISDAVRRAYVDARLEETDQSVGPVPLYELIAGQRRLSCEQIDGLTGRRAAQRLAEIGIDGSAIVDDDEPLAGFIYATERVGLIFVRAEDPLVRRRFTAAHELGHRLMHLDPERDGGELLKTDLLHSEGEAASLETVRPDEPDALTLSVVERQANRFAAELLMPAARCRRLVAGYYHQLGAAPARFLEHQLAGDLLVSREAARWRLRDLSLLPRTGG